MLLAAKTRPVQVRCCDSEKLIGPQKAVTDPAISDAAEQSAYSFTGLQTYCKGVPLLQSHLRLSLSMHSTGHTSGWALTR